MQSILLLGTRSEFTATVLTHLARADIARIRLGILKESPPPLRDPPAATPTLPVSVSDVLTGAAEAFGTPVTPLDGPGDVEACVPRPDLIVTACFPRRLPPAVLSLPRAGGLNVHPSLLPAYRGPCPIFWQLRAGETRGGVTVHRLTEALDAGDVVASTGLSLAAGASGREIEAALVDAGARLLVSVLTGHPWDTLPAEPQDESRASYFPRPGPEDFRLDGRWSAEHAFRFMRGTAEWNHTWSLDAGETRLMLDRAVDFDPDAALPTPWRRAGNDLADVAFASGVLRAVLREATPTR